MTDTEDDISWADELIANQPLEDLYVPFEDLASTFPEHYRSPSAPPSSWDLARKVFMGFGKYRDLTIDEVFSKDPGYLHWALENCSKLNPTTRQILEDIL